LEDHQIKQEQQNQFIPKDHNILMKTKKMKFFTFEYKPSEKCCLCKKKTRLCNCVNCKFCGTLLKKNQNCRYCKEKNNVKDFVITNAELNALEDLGMVDLKTMFKLKRGKEIEEWQKRWRDVWHRFVRKIDNPAKK
jgi:hypothetical protein